jgi:chitinase
MFDSLFPNRNAIYTYAGLVQAAGMSPTFATTGTSDDQKREVAAFLANVGHETGDLVYVEEIAKAVYCQASANCPCASGQEYYGRGALQLSWNYNYCSAGAALGQNLQANPELVATDPTLAWGTGVWFWMTSTGSTAQTCHDAINSSGFGATIQVINGGLECNGANQTEMQDRVTRYLNLCSTFGVSPGSNTTC